MSLEESLSAVEQLIEQVSAALLAADPTSLEKNSTALRDAAADFSRALEQAAARGLPLPASLQKRADAIRSMLILHRESLARLAASTDRQAAGLLPPPMRRLPMAMAWGRAEPRRVWHASTALQAERHPLF